MGPTGIAVVLTTYWLTGVVGAASLSPGDQYSPYQSSHRRDVAQVPLNYPNWLKYQQELTTRLESTDYTPGRRRDDNFIPSDYKTRKDSAIRDLDILPTLTEEWKATSSANDKKHFSELATLNLGITEDSEKNFAANDDEFVRDDTFQDQGPGSVEVYKLDLHGESSVLVPQVDGKHTVMGPRIKSKIPKKATAEVIHWKLKSVDTNKTPLPATFQQPANLDTDSTLSRASRGKINENRKDEVFTIGGVPELQVGCEGLEASNRQKRSGKPGLKNTNDGDWDDSDKYQDPVYRESTEPILLRVTPIVLDLEEEAPPSGEIYEEMDELLKLKKLESTSPEPTTRRWNRGDIDPVLEMDKRQEERPMLDTLPERGDLGPSSNTSDSEAERSVDPEASKRNRSRRDTVAIDAAASFDSDAKDGTAISGSSVGQTDSMNHRSGRKLLWARYPERQQHQNQDTGSRYNPEGNAHREDDDLWGFGESDGVRISDSEDENDMDQPRQAEFDKRRREYERRKQEMNRGLEAVGGGHQPHPENVHYRDRDVNAEIEKIRMEYEKQLEKQQRERRRNEMRQRQDEESKRRLEEEQRRKEWNRRRENEEKRRRLEHHRNHGDPPSALTRPESRRDQDEARSQRDKENEENKLRNYIERNRPIHPTKTSLPTRPGGTTRKDESNDHKRYIEDQRKRQIEEERRRQQMEEYQRRRTEEHQRRHMEAARRRQTEEEQRQRQRDEEERRRHVEEQRRSNRTGSQAMEEEQRRRLEEERKLQDYVRRNQPVIVPRQNGSRASNSSQENDLQEQRRTIEAARQWDRNRRPIMRGDGGRVHGPSAPTNIGHRHGQDDLEDRRRDQERLEEKRQWEMNQRRLQEEERRREAEYQHAESRRHEKERKRLAEIARRVEENRRTESAARRNGWQDYGSSRRPSGEIPDREAGNLRRQESAGRTADNALRNQQDEWRTRSEERARQQQREERERQRLENERNSRNSRRRRPHHEDHRPKSGQRGEGVRGGHDPIESRRREHARLSSLPVSARIILRSDGALRNGGETPPVPTSSTSLQPSETSIDSRSNFDNGIDFPAISPNRPGLAAPRFPAPRTPRPPAQSPGACVWAIVQCCPANNRLTSCFESMGCPGVNWDSSPCRSSLTDMARAEIVKFYQSAEKEKTRF